MAKVRWKKSTEAKVSAAVAYRFFNRIIKENGGTFDLDEALRQSKPKDAPLHNELEWNDKICGTKYRKEQIRYLQRHLEVVRADMPSAPFNAFTSVKVEGESDNGTEAVTTTCFMRTEDMLADPAGRAELLGRAVRDALAFRRKYAVLSELATLIEVIDTEISKLG